MHFFTVLKNENGQEIELTPIWGNIEIPISMSNSLFNANIRYLQDSYRGNDRIKQNELEQIVGKSIPFTIYLALWTAIPVRFKQFMENKVMDQHLRIPLNIVYLKKDKKGTRCFRELMNKGTHKPTIGQEKWINELALDNELNWQKQYQLSTNCNANARIRFFQYQILQRTLLTNRKLHIFKLIDTEKCDNCDKVETIAHLLLDCKQLEQIWNEHERWINHNINKRVQFDKRSIILGNPENSIIVNYIFMLTKHEIYKSKWQKKVTLENIIKKLQYYLQIEEYVNTVSIGRGKTLGKWSPIYHTQKIRR